MAEFGAAQHRKGRFQALGGLSCCSNWPYVARAGIERLHATRGKNKIAFSVAGCFTVLFLVIFVPRSSGRRAALSSDLSGPSTTTDSGPSAAPPRWGSDGGGAITHMTAVEQRLAQHLGVSVVAAAACSSDPLLAGWTEADFAPAVDEHRLFRKRRAQRLGHARDGDGGALLHLSPALSPCERLQRVGPRGKGGAHVCRSLWDAARSCAVAAYGGSADVGALDAFEEAVAGLPRTECDVHR